MVFVKLCVCICDMDVILFEFDLISMIGLDIMKILFIYLIKTKFLLISDEAILMHTTIDDYDLLLSSIITINTDEEDVVGSIESNYYKSVRYMFFCLLPKLEQNRMILNHIQKSLNEYLESQCAAFERFYLVGDDLLEINCNAKDTIKMNKRLSKMLAAIAQLVLLPDYQQMETVI